MHGRPDLSVSDREHRLDQPRDPCRRIDVADIALDGPERTVPAALRRPFERLDQGGDLDRVA
jgi:hypothetical protein